MQTSAVSSGATSAVPLLRRVLRAGGWTLGGYAIGLAVRFGSSLLMTRLLLPEAFGLIAVAIALVTALAMFTDVGLRQSVVQTRQGDDPRFLDTVWVVQILRGAAICAVALGGSLLLALAIDGGMLTFAGVYGEPDLPRVIAAVSFSALLAGLESTRVFEAYRKLSFARITQMEILAQLVGLVAMLGWVAADRSIWALVAGTLAAAVARVALSHAWLPGHRNRWNWDPGCWREIFGFGKWVFASSALGFLVNSGDRLLLAALFDKTTLGISVIAFLLFGAVEQAIGKVVGDVSFPAFSEVARDRPAALRSVLYRFHLAIGVPVFAAAGLLATLGADLVALLYDARYADAGWMLQILALALLALPYRVATQCFLALGNARFLSQLIAVRLVALVALTLLGFHLLGMPGALAGIVASHFAYLPMIFREQIRRGLFDPIRELMLLPAALAGAGAGYAVLRVAG